MIVFSSVWGTGRTFSSSLFLTTVLSPSPSRSRSMTVVSSAFTLVVIGAATSVAAMQVKISLRINWLLLLRQLDNFELFSLFRFPYSPPILRNNPRNESSLEPFRTTSLEELGC